MFPEHGPDAFVIRLVDARQVNVVSGDRFLVLSHVTTSQVAKVIVDYRLIPRALVVFAIQLSGFIVDESQELTVRDVRFSQVAWVCVRGRDYLSDLQVLRVLTEVSDKDLEGGIGDHFCNTITGEKRLLPVHLGAGLNQDRA